MSMLTVYDMKGAASGEIEFPDDLLVVRKGGQAVHDAVVATRAAHRAGTASTLSKGRVAGTGAKPWRQKGTGRARAGYKQSPVWRGGGVAFGPHPRDFAVKVNRKATRLAFQRVFSEKLAAGAVKVVETVALDEPKTHLWTALMKTLDLSGPTLFMLGSIDEKVRLASRNLANVEVLRADNVGVYTLLRYPAIVADRAGMEAIEKRFGAWRRRTGTETEPDRSPAAETDGGEEVA
jgi:large subunit ribosomal protein L4